MAPVREALAKECAHGFSRGGYVDVEVLRGGFDVEIQRVCEPVIWTIFRGGRILGPIRFEPYCR